MTGRGPSLKFSACTTEVFGPAGDSNDGDPPAAGAPGIVATARSCQPKIRFLDCIACFEPACGLTPLLGEFAWVIHCMYRPRLQKMNFSPSRFATVPFELRVGCDLADARR